ncbi:helix-turn-helix domain-containing protein [uncultured Flavobacterium sp.]|uniref:helix-turn-helix domain-containing protein n=1 Tax=uncultured Flavobacterium sp. TaxID=165435 RepID=UPI0025D75209|nr:helix-turn-helix domain-containing protein [uncultured Flavobacterium sp.]
MGKKILDISEFTKYLNLKSIKNEDLHIVNFQNEENVLLKSEAVTIDFYLLAIKPPFDKNLVQQELLEDQSNSYMYVDCPHNSIGWDIAPPSSGYAIMVSGKYLSKMAKNYNFTHYDSHHEALFLTKEEEALLWDLYKKAYDEFSKQYYSKDIIISYITLILTYTQAFYDRQFDTRSKIYHKVISDFNNHLEDFFNQEESVAGLPSVAYFAQKSNLSPNYFGDLIKHFTGSSPTEHIQDFVVQLAKDKLSNTNLSVSEISYSLGFDYPNYFARFFRKKTGLSPKVFRNQ